MMDPRWVLAREGNALSRNDGFMQRECSDDMGTLDPFTLAADRVQDIDTRGGGSVQILMAAPKALHQCRFILCA